MDNNNIFLAMKAVVVSAFGAFGAAFGWLGFLALAWIGAMVVDYITGSAAAMKAGNWASSVARAGIWHKAGEIVVVIVAALADSVLALVIANIPAIPIQYTVLILPIVLVWYILTEIGSILENVAAMGSDIPPFLIKFLASAKDKVEETMENSTEEQNNH